MKPEKRYNVQDNMQKSTVHLNFFNEWMNFW